MSSLTNKLVFIVDDDPDDRQIILEALLENHPTLDYMFIDSAEDLLSRLDTPDAERPHLILLDLNMPGIMGLQALHEIRGNKTYSQIPIIVMTSSTLSRDRQLSYELGASCFLTKPGSYKKMVSITHAIITLWLFED